MVSLLFIACADAESDAVLEVLDGDVRVESV